MPPRSSRGAGPSRLSIIFGLLLLLRPLAGALLAPWVFAVFAIVGGIASIITAFRMK
jgi:uncharacterized membrane protein HdeD (DUF308 family)